MPVQLSAQQSEEKGNGLGGHMECNEISRGCESPVKKQKGIHMSSSKRLVVSRYGESMVDQCLPSSYLHSEANRDQSRDHPVSVPEIIQCII